MKYEAELKNLLNNAYEPYTNYHVSAIVVMNDGKLIGGVNVNNAAFSNNMCAERNAIHTAITAGYKKGDFKEIYIMHNKLITPCGACLQTMAEFFNPDTKVISVSTDGKSEEHLFSELLPVIYNNESLV